MHLLRKITLPLLFVSVVLTLWLAGSARATRIPLVMKRDGTTLYQDAVAVRDANSQSVLSFVRTLVAG